jgi:hypothetical protein
LSLYASRVWRCQPCMLRLDEGASTRARWLQQMQRLASHTSPLFRMLTSVEVSLAAVGRCCCLRNKPRRRQSGRKHDQGTPVTRTSTANPDCLLRMYPPLYTSVLRSIHPRELQALAPPECQVPLSRLHGVGLACDDIRNGTRGCRRTDRRASSGRKGKAGRR